MASRSILDVDRLVGAVERFAVIALPISQATRRDNSRSDSPLSQHGNGNGAIRTLFRADPTARIQALYEEFAGIRRNTEESRRFVAGRRETACDLLPIAFGRAKKNEPIENQPPERSAIEQGVVDVSLEPCHPDSPDATDRVDLKTFAGELGRTIDALRTGLDSGDLDAIRQVASELERSGESRGFAILARTAGQLEQTARHSDAVTPSVRHGVQETVHACKCVQALAHRHHRSWLRFETEVREVVVELGVSGPFSARVIDESYGGIRLASDEFAGCEPGTEASIHYGAAPMRAVARRVRSSDGEKCQVGFEWTRPSASSTRRDASVADA